jgi:hypothetical protein
MGIKDLESSMYRIFSLKEEIERVASGIEGIDDVFGTITLRMPKFNPAELGFLRTVSWLYVLYYEAGKVNIEFISERFSAYKLDPNNELNRHIVTIQRLRTYSQHNLNPNKLQSRNIQEYCEQWLKNNCGTPVPEDDDHWETCLTCILNEAFNFLSAIRDCIRSIEQDESLEQIIYEWDIARKRYHPPHEFDELIKEIAADMGRENLDATRLRKRFYDAWVKELGVLQGNYNFKVEARKLIEHALLDKMTPMLPITGRDILRKLDIPPGPQVGNLLEQARIIYNNEHCSRDELLEKLRMHK